MPDPEGDECPALEEHFVWLSKDYAPYDNDPGSPFIPPDFTLGLPSVWDWPRQAGEPPWILDPEECPKPVHKVPVDSTRASSMDEGKKKKKKKHRHSKKSEKPELKVITRGEGADTPVWTHAGPTKDSSSSSDSQSDGDSGLGSNPSIQPHRGIDTESWRGVALWLSPDATREPMENDPLSDQGGGNGDQDMPDANEPPGDCDSAGSGPVPVLIPDEAQEGAQLGDDQAEAGDDEEPQEHEEPLEPYQIVLQGFRTISQTLSAAYGAASAEIQIIVRKSLAKTTTEDQTFVWRASGAIRQWIDSIRLAMASSEESTKDQAQLLAEARQARKDVLETILNFIPEEEEPKLTSVFPRATHLLAPALAVARWYTDDALWNIHTQLSDLVKEHVPEEQAGAFFNTILQVTCSFWQEMDNMATNQVFLPSQIIPNLWGSHRGLLERLSLLGPPSCLASWPASLVEWVTAVPAPQNVPGSSKTPTKSNPPPSRAVKATLDSGKKSHQSAKQVARLFWGDPERGKEDAEVRKQEEKHRKKSAGPVLSLDDHEDSVTDLMKWAAPSQVSQPLNKASSSSSRDRGKVRVKHPPADQSNNKPLSDRADEPKAKNRKWDPTPDLVILEDDDSTPLPRKIKGMGKKARTHNPGKDEGFEALFQGLKGKARAVQYNLELAILTEYQNFHIPNLKGPPNTDDHLAYLSNVKDMSWSYPAKGNLITARQFFKDLKASKDLEAMEAGDNILWEKGMMGILQESLKAGPIKCRYVIFVLRSVEGKIIDTLDLDYRWDWNIRLYDIVSPASTRKVEKTGTLVYKGRVVQGKVTYRYCPFCSYASTNHWTLNNHIQMHLCLTLACGMKDCWFVTYSSDLMWKHAASHELTILEPIAVNTKKKWIRVHTCISHSFTGYHNRW